MAKKSSTAGLLLSLVLGSASANAKEVDFATMDRLDGESRVGTSAGFTFFDADGTEAIDFALRTDLFGQFVHESGGAAYAALPISYVSADPEGEGAMGNLEVGGGYVLPLDDTELAFRAGLVLPTSNEEDVFVNLLGVVAPRLTDLVTTAPDATWMRLSTSPIWRRGDFFLRADLGVDIQLDSDRVADADPLLRGNVGAGVLAGELAITGELVTIGTTGEVDSEYDRFAHTGALGARWTGGRVHPGLAVVTPLDDGGLGELWAMVADLSVSLD